MIWGLQLHKTQKAVLAGVFSPGFVVAIFDIVRRVESLESGTLPGVALWSSLEVTIAVIDASLPLCRVLLTSKRRRSLMSSRSMSHFRHNSNSQSGHERKESDDSSPHSTKSAASTFRDRLETLDYDPYSLSSLRSP